MFRLFLLGNHLDRLKGKVKHVPALQLAIIRQCGWITVCRLLSLKEPLPKGKQWKRSLF
jgi:hypothetical protein